LSGRFVETNRIVMKIFLSICIPFLLAFAVFGQKKTKDEIVLSFTNTDNSKFERTDDSTGSNLKFIEIEISAIGDKKVTKDYLLEFELEHITSSEKSIRLINSSVQVTKDDLFQNRTQTRKVEFQVFNSNSLEKEIAKLKVRCNGVHSLAEQHQRYIELITVKENEKTEEQNEESADYAAIALANLLLADTVSAATIQLATYLEGDKYVDEHNNLKFSIDCVQVFFENGRIQRVQVFPKDDDGVFQSQYPISATYFNKLRESRLHYQGSNQSFNEKYVELGKVINYTESMSRSQFPPDGHIILKPDENTSEVIEFYRNPISYFDARIYTDPTSITGNSNGLVLTELNSSFILNTRNHSYVTLVPYINLNFNWAKFDSQFDTLAFSNLTTRKANDILSLRQQAKINFFIDLELFRYSGKHESILGFGHHLAVTNVSDTTGQSLRSLNPSFYLYWRGELFANPWLKLDCMLPIFAQYNHDQVFTEYGKKWDFIIAPQIEISILPAKFKVKSETNNEPDGAKLFARVRYFDMPSAKGNNFVQFQTGVSFSISDLFSKK